MLGIQIQNCSLNPYIDFLENKINPKLDKALDMLIVRLMNSDEIQKHQEKLKERRVLDRIEQRRIEKQRLKEELGSQYSSSEEEDSYDEDLSLNQENSHRNGNTNAGPMKVFGEFSNEQIPSSETKPLIDALENQKVAELADEEEEDGELDYEREKELELSRLKRQRAGFNCVKFLVDSLKKLHSNN